MLQRLTTQPSTLNPQPSGVPPIVHEVLLSPGHPLDAATSAFMESRFGHDFTGVRVHTNAQAAESARAVHARAYTVGNAVVFAADATESVMLSFEPFAICAGANQKSRITGGFAVWI